MTAALSERENPGGSPEFWGEEIVGSVSDMWNLRTFEAPRGSAESAGAGVSARLAGEASPGDGAESVRRWLWDSRVGMRLLAGESGPRGSDQRGRREVRTELFCRSQGVWG